MKIAILAVYFGTLPPFTQLFLASCNRNKSIDFLLIGDAWKDLSDDIPSNCHLNPMDLNQLKDLIKQTTGFDPNFSSPYKLCDFKPVFGEIFQDELSGYNYWGFTDIDLILGDLTEFMDSLSQYDIFSTRKEFLSGPFFMMRNNAKINSLYRNSKDIECVLTSEHHFCFDECNFAWVELKAGRSILDIETQIESMTEVIAKAEKEGLSVHYKTLSLEPQKSFLGKVEVKNGKIKMNGKQFIHYHHHLNKGRALYTFPSWHWKEVPESFHISKYGVYPKGLPNNLRYRYSQFARCWSKRIKKQICEYKSRKGVITTKIA